MDLRLTTILKRVLNQQQQNHSKAKQGDKTKMEEQKFHKLNEGIATRYITLEGMGHKNCKDLQEFLRKLKSQSKDIFFDCDFSFLRNSCKSLQFLCPIPSKVMYLVAIPSFNLWNFCSSILVLSPCFAFEWFCCCWFNTRLSIVVNRKSIFFT